MISFALVLSVFICLLILLFVLYIYYSFNLSSEREVEHYIKCELIGGGFSRYLETRLLTCLLWQYTI